MSVDSNTILSMQMKRLFNASKNIDNLDILANEKLTNDSNWFHSNGSCLIGTKQEICNLRLSSGAYQEQFEDSIKFSVVDID